MGSKGIDDLLVGDRQEDVYELCDQDEAKRRHYPQLQPNFAFGPEQRQNATDHGELVFPAEPRFAPLIRFSGKRPANLHGPYIGRQSLPLKLWLGWNWRSPA